MLALNQELCRQAAALTHWTMSRKAHRLALTARELLESGADTVPCEILDKYEADQAESRQIVRVLSTR